MNSNIVQVQQNSGISFNPEEILLLKKSILDDKTTDAELALFSKVCQRTGLDPFARQIFGIRRDGKDGGKLSFQTSVDGYRLIADRTRCYAGSDDPLFDEGLSLYQHLKSDRSNPITATVTVWKIVQGVRCPFVASVSWEQYSQTYYDQSSKSRKLTSTWAKMPHLMLGKCAESLALRKAFPAELSGIYTSEEFPPEQEAFTDRQSVSRPVEVLQASTPAPKQLSAVPVSKPKPGSATIARIEAETKAEQEAAFTPPPGINEAAFYQVIDTLNRLKWPTFHIQNCLTANFNKAWLTELTDDQLLDFIDYLADFELSTTEIRRLGWDKEYGQSVLKMQFGVETRNNLNAQQLKECLAFLKTQ